jgi:hypothetical protein
VRQKKNVGFVQAYLFLMEKVHSTKFNSSVIEMQWITWTKIRYLLSSQFPTEIIFLIGKILFEFHYLASQYPQNVTEWMNFGYGRKVIYMKEVETISGGRKRYYWGYLWFTGKFFIFNQIKKNTKVMRQLLKIKNKNLTFGVYERRLTENHFDYWTEGLQKHGIIDPFSMNLFRDDWYE